MDPPEKCKVEKLWHTQYSNDLRHHMLSKLVRAMIPFVDPSEFGEEKVQCLIKYGRKTEKEFFECADDTEEYYHLVAEKIHKIFLNLGGKRKERLKARVSGA
ncbi:hypothetical protein PMAYCL1PPCAC_19467, partial [Pristionchus mayeri]